MEPSADWGINIATALAEGATRIVADARRASWRLAEIGLAARARRTTAHAEWFCSLPWYRRWLVMVLGR